MLCGDCLCSVCARSETNGIWADGVEKNCTGCNDCNGVVDLEEDCPTHGYIADDSLEASEEYV